ncbi:hypothetical protein Thiowin_04566 [Thiorhodovibrio winogradskyi]|uniref:Uncharacterized protein n=1 Tax=Thiorhodovibrio winogradskyi TaxID=77007 RepID=A0ABZ0SIJ8_9GAMM
MGSTSQVDLGAPGVGVKIHDMQAGGGHVVDVQEFAAWSAAAPDGDGGGGVECGLVEAADQGGQDVAVGQVEVSPGP